MIFHKYLEKLLGSKVKINILRTLYKFPDKDFTTRELAAFIGASHSGILKALVDLEEMNAVHIRMHGRAHMLRLNKKSLVAKNVLKIFDFERETINYLIAELRKIFEGLNITSAVVFGSVVKHSEAPGSDIDILVVSEKKNVEKEITVRQKDFSERFGNSMALYLMTPEKFRRIKNSKLIKDVLEYHIHLAGKKLEDIV